jgi:hypothetical protein
MAKYCQEKFVNQENGNELIVCWRQDKHVHDASLITTIEQWLQNNHGSNWEVRANSYQSNLQSCSLKAVEYS